MSAFVVQFSLVSVMLITAGTKNSKSSKDYRGTHQKLTMFSDTCSKCKVTRKRALATL